ncbi:MAG TPA: DNA polymerase III subunit gamma/tau [Vicinamibacterales bacterium]|nr:DNA polymerase III subunit gamma/tau [Vicinamibacterales bacterium]
MSHVALARKWRPQQFEDVIGQRGVVLTLKNAITTSRLAQAFIFAGPRGVGKTTTARILARALNCVKGPTPEPCGKCDACIEISEGRDLDVLEIDGATYTGVDAVREVIVEPLSIAPMRDRFKIFIIDEVHRLSKSAFDALLKSIEEPPPYVKFMMATTELHAVPATIQSRSQVFELKALPFSAIRDQLKKVTSSEKVKIDDAALALVARSAEGSMRDALSALDQVLAFTSDRVTLEDVSTVLGLIGRDLQFEIAETVANEDAAASFTLAGRVVEAGFDLRVVCRELARLVRDLLVIRIDPTRVNDPEIASEGEADRLKALAARSSREDLLRAFDLLARAEGEIRYSSQPRHHFEMALVKWIQLRKLVPIEDLIAAMQSGGSVPLTPAQARPAAPPSAPVRPAAPARSPTPPQPPQPTRTAEPQGTSGNPREPQGTASADLKSSLLASVREQNKTFFGMVVAQAQNVAVEGDTVAFTFAPVHKGLRAQFDSKRGWLEHLAQAVAGRKITVVAREGQPAPAASGSDESSSSRKAGLRDRAKAEPTVQAVLDVFGGEIEDVEEIDK